MGGDGGIDFVSHSRSYHSEQSVLLSEMKRDSRDLRSLGRRLWIARTRDEKFLTTAYEEISPSRDRIEERLRHSN